MSSVTSTEASTFRPWHFFVVLTLLAATAAVLTSRKVTPEHLVLLSATVFAAGASALALYRTLLPLASRERRLAGESLGHRARAAVEREKLLVLRSIKELEFDRAMGKLAPEDFDDMAQRLRARALRLMQQLDADTAAPRERLERELAERLREGSARGDGRPADSPTAPSGVAAPDERAQTVTCPSCGVSNDEDARFCKSCGTRLDAGEAATAAEEKGQTS